MVISPFAFEAIDWNACERKQQPGERGMANWRTAQLGEVRIRMVEYEPGYKSDHWCQKGHVVLCLSGELRTQLQDGSEVVLTPGMSYLVGDGGDAHRSSAPLGATLFIVD